jgi:hypothetical protein
VRAPLLRELAGVRLALDRDEDEDEDDDDGERLAGGMGRAPAPY